MRPSFRNIPEFEKNKIKFIDEEYFFLVSSGKRIFLGTYEINGNHVLVILDDDNKYVFQEFSFSREEIWLDFCFFKKLFEGAEVSLIDKIKMMFQEFVQGFKFKIKSGETSLCF